jgi:hypothetical protein
VFVLCQEKLHATICLAHEGRPLAVIDYATRNELCKQDYASILYHSPSIELAKVLILTEKLHQYKLTLFEAANILFMKHKTSDGLALLKDFAAMLIPPEDNFGVALQQLVSLDTETSMRVWKSLANMCSSVSEEDFKLLGQTFSTKGLKERHETECKD